MFHLVNAVPGASRNYYRKLILDSGIRPDLRSGTPIAVPSDFDRNKWKLLLLSAATLTESLYDAHREHPTNSQVAASISKGFTGVKLVNPRIPEDAIDYIRDYQNGLVGVGAKTSFLEHLRTVPAIEEEWLKERRSLASKQRQNKDGQPDTAEAEGDDDKKGRTQANYESDWFAWISRVFPNRFDSFNMFDKAKRSLHKMQELQIYSEFGSYCDNVCEFHDPNLNSKTAFTIADRILKLFGESYPRLSLMLLKLSIPTNDAIPWIIVTPATSRSSAT